MQPPRRRDTVALVGELKRERRNAMVLAVIGFVVLVSLIVYFLKLSRSDVPQAPAWQSSATAATKPGESGTATSKPASPLGAVTPPSAGTPASAVAPGAPGGSTAPGLPAGGTTAASTPEGSAKPAAAAAPAKPAPTTGEVIIELAKPGPIWVDGQQIGKSVRTHTAQLTPGKHKVKTWAGKALTQAFDVEAGRSYHVTVDARRKKIVVEPGK